MYSDRFTYFLKDELDPQRCGDIGTGIIECLDQYTSEPYVDCDKLTPFLNVEASDGGDRGFKALRAK